jgi:hypothetical protein
MFEGIDYEAEGFGALKMPKINIGKGIKNVGKELGRGAKNISAEVGRGIKNMSGMFKGKKRIAMAKRAAPRIAAMAVGAAGGKPKSRMTSAMGVGMSGFGEEPGFWSTFSLKDTVNAAADITKTAVGIDKDINSMRKQPAPPSWGPSEEGSKTIYYVAGGAALALGAFLFLRR